MSKASVVLSELEVNLILSSLRINRIIAKDNNLPMLEKDLAKVISHINKVAK